MTPLRRASTTEAARVYDYVKWAIINGVYVGGDVLTVSYLTAEVGAADSAVRESLVRLNVEGMVRFSSEGAGVVTSYSPDDAEDVLDARMMLEMFVAEKCFAARHHVLDQVEQIHAEMAGSAREQDTAAFARHDRRFHEAIVDAAGNRVLSGFYRSLRERQSMFTSALVRGHAEMMNVGLREHERIIEAMRGDDAEIFCNVVEEHLRWSIKLARELI